MTILVTGATGNVGRNVVDQLVQRGANIRALVRDPAKAKLPAGVFVAMAGDAVLTTAPSFASTDHDRSSTSPPR